MADDNNPDNIRIKEDIRIKEEKGFPAGDEMLLNDDIDGKIEGEKEDPLIKDPLILDHLISVSSMSDEELNDFCSKNMISLSSEEIRSLPEKIGREPTLTELHIFNIQWSEHSSYKTSKKWLKMLPTKGSQVIIGPVEDSGIVKLGEWKGSSYGVIVSHESHNHPSQVVPYEGAATGVGGIVRDVLCMGGDVIANADPLRFGNVKGKNKNKASFIANNVVDGIAGYGNPLGIPVIAGDVYFNSSFDDNALVNVVSLGLVKEEDIIHSYAPERADGYDVIVVGKATDSSGFGGAAFASLVLDENKEESNKGAVQVPDPFLKNILIRATQKVFKEIKEKGIKAGFKDMGAGGIMCATSEMASDAGYGVEINLDDIHVSMEDLPPYVIASAETQERFCWFVPESFTKRVLEIYNDEYALPKVAKKARASVVGKVLKEQVYRLKHKGVLVCNAPIDEVTKGVSHDRPVKDPERSFEEPVLDEPELSEYNSLLLSLLSHENICSRARIYKHYDTEVKGNAVIRPGEADAGLIAPIRGSSLGVALSVDSNPRYNRISPFHGASLAVAEAMRNIACIGAIPTALTDCLNYGNPEVPEYLWEFVEGVKGITLAAEELYYYPEKDKKSPVPIVSGNVSFYNQSSNGNSVDPSPIISCVGVMKDYSKAITTGLKKEGNIIYFIGTIKDEMGGSVYYDIKGLLGKNIPSVDFSEERKKIYSLIELIGEGKIFSAHDVSEGGIAVCLSEMLILGNKGVTADISKTGLRADKALFSESPVIVIEVSEHDKEHVEKYLDDKGVKFIEIGKVSSEGLKIFYGREELINLSTDELKEKWENSLKEVLG